jgi:DNA-binding FadR family transcriptional regulator
VVDLAQVDRAPVEHRARERVNRRAVLSALVDQLQPADRLGSERELAEQLSVSRVTVREALRALEGMGKVEIRRNSGTFVARPAPHTLVTVRPPDQVDADWVRHLSEVRAGIECQVVRLLGQQSALDLSAAEDTLERAEQEIAQESQQGSLDPGFEAALGQATATPSSWSFSGRSTSFGCRRGSRWAARSRTVATSTSSTSTSFGR